MWELAMREINSGLYRENIRLSRPADKDYRLLTAYPPYNEAFLNPDTPEVRRKLFASYEQLENKNWYYKFDEVTVSIQINKDVFYEYS